MSYYRVMTKEEAERKRYELLADGYYRAVVDKSDGKLSAAGNYMAAMELSVFDASRKAYPVRDFLVFTEKMMWKTIHFCESSGLEKEYNEGDFTAEMAAGREVSVLIKIEKGKEIPFDKLNGKIPGSRYPDKNVVVDYVVMDALSIPPATSTDVPAPKDETFFNDDINF